MEKHRLTRRDFTAGGFGLIGAGLPGRRRARPDGGAEGAGRAQHHRRRRQSRVDQARDRGFRQGQSDLVSHVAFSQAPAPELPAKIKAQQGANHVDIDSC